MNNFYLSEIKNNIFKFFAGSQKKWLRGRQFFIKDFSQIRNYSQVMNNPACCNYLLKSNFFKDFKRKKHPPVGGRYICITPLL